MNYDSRDKAFLKKEVSTFADVNEITNLITMPKLIFLGLDSYNFYILKNFMKSNTAMEIKIGGK